MRTTSTKHHPKCVLTSIPPYMRDRVTQLLADFRADCHTGFNKPVMRTGLPYTPEEKLLIMRANSLRGLAERLMRSYSSLKVLRRRWRRLGVPK